MLHFWRKGYYASSIETAAAALDVDRHVLYTEFHGKQALFAAALRAYVNTVATAAFAPVEAEDAGLEAVHGYYAAQVEKVIDAGLPGPGCFIANTVTASAPQNKVFRRIADDYVQRLRRGFANVIANEARRRGIEIDEPDLLVEFLTASAPSLWLYAQHTECAVSLRDYPTALVDIVDEKLR